MSSEILVLNAGSSSLRFAVFGPGQGADYMAIRIQGQVSGIGSSPAFKASIRSRDEAGIKTDAALIEKINSHQEAIDFSLAWLEEYAGDIQLAAAGHRVVHGGPDRHEPALVTPELLSELETLSRLAPHHQPHNLAAIRALALAKPDLPQVACFDTAFHTGQSSTARMLPLPRSLRDEGLQRYGFHGLSYEFIAAKVPEYNQGRMPERLIVAHLGNGASLCAIRNGKGIASSMGFSTLDGLMMGTRSGSIDPGVLLHLMREQKMDEPALSDLLYNQSGLLGVSGISGDMQVLLNSDETSAQEAIDLYCYTLQRAIGSMAAVLGGLDALVFTGGIGENATAIREKVCARLSWLGLDFADDANQSGEIRISAPGSKVKVWVIPTNEEQVIAQHTFECIQPGSND